MCTYTYECEFVHAMEYVWVRHNFWEPVHSAHCVCHCDQTQATRLDRKYVYLPSLLIHSHKFFCLYFSRLLALSCAFPGISPWADNISSFNSFAQIEASWPYHQITPFSCVTLHTHTFIQSMSYVLSNLFSRFCFMNL